MTQVFQTINHPIKGNCLQAAVASLFDKQLHEVPNFIDLSENDWFDVFQSFIKSQSYQYEGFISDTHENAIGSLKSLSYYKGINNYFLVSVKHPLQTTSHAVVYQRSEDGQFRLIHDPLNWFSPDYFINFVYLIEPSLSTSFC